jgi:hypothetical protein
MHKVWQRVHGNQESDGVIQNGTLDRHCQSLVYEQQAIANGLKLPESNGPEEKRQC